MDEKMSLLKALNGELQINEEQFSNLIEKIPFPVVLSSVKDSRFLHVNQRAADLFDLPYKEMPKANAHDYYVNPHERQMLLDNLLATGRVRDCEAILKTKSGLPFSALVSVTIIVFKDVLAVCSVFNNITDHKRLEEELNKAQLRFDQIIDFLPDATFVIDREGKVIAWNRAMEEMTGVYKSDMIGKGNYEYALPFYGERRRLMADLVLLPDEDFKRGNYDTVIKQGNVLYAEVYVPKIYKNKGAYLWGTASLLRDAAGNITGAIESLRDITERKQAEESMRELGNRYRTVFENTGTATVIIEGDKTISLANTEFERITGYTRGEIEGKKKWTEFVVKEDVERMAQQHNLRRIDEDAAQKKYEFRLVDKDGQIKNIYLNIDVIPGTKQKSVASFLDITERKRREEEREHLISKLQSTIEEVKTLRGIVPICSYCKRIRDDKGYWEQVESYVSKNSEAEFSHSICPVCVKKHYPKHCNDETDLQE
ncbi:MAG: PAS domain S-box protein [Smithellaceae bacterium]